MLPSWLKRFFVRGLTVALWVCLALCPSQSVLAQGTAPDASAAARAAELKKEGDGYMDNLDFKKALDLYEQAYALSKDPVLLYNSGRALQGLDRYPEALDRLEEFRRDAPPQLLARVPGLDGLVAKVAANVATLTIQCNVAEARVLVSGKMVGETPLGGLRVNAGSTKIEVFKDGYQPASMTVSLAGGKARTVAFELLTASRSGLVVVSSNVSGATVAVGGKALGVAPAQTELPVGEHAVEVTHPDYELFATTIVVRAGLTIRVDAELEQSTPIYEEWWFWTIAGAVVVGGAVTGIVIAATTERDPDSGDIPPGQVAAPLRAAPTRATIGVLLPLWRF